MIICICLFEYHPFTLYSKGTYYSVISHLLDVGILDV